MNDTNTEYPFRKSRKPYFIGIASAVIVVGILTYGVVAHNAVLWPFNETTEKSDNPENTNKLSDSDIIFEKPTIDKEAKTVRLFAAVNTKEQGDCTLKLESQDTSVSFNMSTKGLDHGETGCLDWNISTDTLKEGLYDAEISFTQENGNTIKSTAQVKIP